MSSLYAMILKPFLGFAFGTKGRSKITVIIILALVMGVGVWFVNNHIGKLQTELALKTQALDESNAANVGLVAAVDGLNKHIETQATEFNSAIANREQLEEKLSISKQEKDDAQDVFDKECGRLERLMQKKASLIVRFANRATDKLRKEFQETTSDNEGGD